MFSDYLFVRHVSVPYVLACLAFNIIVNIKILFYFVIKVFLE